MKRKNSSVELALHPMLTAFLCGVDDLYRSWDSELTITSGSETTARHGYTSLHYATPCQAVDIRIWETADTPEPVSQQGAIEFLAKEFCENNELGADWIDVILESDHIHIEYQPKRPKNLD